MGPEQEKGYKNREYTNNPVAKLFERHLFIIIFFGELSFGTVSVFGKHLHALGGARSVGETRRLREATEVDGRQDDGDFHEIADC